MAVIVPLLWAKKLSLSSAVVSFLRGAADLMFDQKKVSDSGIKAAGLLRMIRVKVRQSMMKTLVWSDFSLIETISAKTPRKPASKIYSCKGPT